MDAATDPLFAAPTERWIALSPRFLTMKRLMVVCVWGFWTLAAALALGFLWKWWAAGLLAIVGLGWIGYRYWRAGRVYRAWGYAERDTDLYVRSGILFRRLTAVPYGRMQVVEVESGPIQRHFGLASVHLVTASASTNAHIPGLESDAAALLRDRLTERGEHQAAGL